MASSNGALTVHFRRLALVAEQGRSLSGLQAGGAVIERLALVIPLEARGVEARLALCFVGVSTVLGGGRVVRVELRTRLDQPAIRTFLVRLAAKVWCVFFRVQGAINQLKIFQRIIQLVAVLVVNHLITMQRASKMLLHHVAVFTDATTIDRDCLVAERVKAAGPLRSLYEMQPTVFVPARSMHTAPSTVVAVTAGQSVATLDSAGTLGHARIIAFSLSILAIPATLSAQNIQIHTTGNTVTLPVCNGANEALRFTGTAFVCGTITASGGSALPSGSIVMVDSGTCPVGTTEVASLAGRTLLGTLAASADVGTTGGSDSVTPAGTNSVPSLTMNSYTPAGTNSGMAVSAHIGANVTSVFTGAALGTHAHELPFQIPSTTTTRQIAVATFGTGTARAATAVSANGTANTTSAAVALSQSVSAGTPAGTIANTITQASPHTVTNPSFLGTPATLTGAVSAPAWSGVAFDNRSAYTKVLFCKAN